MQPDSTSTLKIKRLHPDAIMPRYATAGAACFDLHSLHAVRLNHDGHYSSHFATIATGLQVEVPEGYVLLVFSRSGMAFNQNMRLGNCVGVIDSDYRGELKIRLACDDQTSHHIIAGIRIAQAMLVAAPRVEIVETATLTETERGEGGFGSTGR